MSLPKFTPVKPGRLNKPAWHRSNVAEFGPVRKAPGDYGPLTTYDVYLNRQLIGSVTGTPKTRPEHPGSDTLVPDGTLRVWAPDRLAVGVAQHGDTRFEAVDALVRTHLTETQQHPIAA
jgi:hypothetical protein